MDLRLATLEAVLADPGRGESLEALILDLARLATDEAQAAAAVAAVEARLEAETHLAHARAAAQEAIEQERAVTSDVRRALEHLEQRQKTLEQERQAEIRSLHERFEAAFATEHARAAELEGGLAQAHIDLEAQRAAETELRRSAAHISERLTGSERDHAHTRAAMSDLSTEVARLRDATDEQERNLAEVKAELASEHVTSLQLRENAAAHERNLHMAQAELASEHEANLQLREALSEQERRLEEARTELEEERGANSRLREATERAKQLLAALSQQKSALQARHQELTTELGRTREALAALQRAHGEIESRLDEERRSNVELRSSFEQTEPFKSAQLDSVEPDSALSSGREEANVAGGIIGPAPASSQLLSAVAEADEGWQPIQLANRYAFKQPLDILINGESGLLFDLSIIGCQLSSSARLKPNHGVRVLLPTRPHSTLCIGKVVWARLESPAAGRPPSYRAGVLFTKVDQEAIELFIASHSAEETR